jgi:DNA topoisomerase-1
VAGSSGEDEASVVYAEQEHLCIERRRRGAGFSYHRNGRRVRGAVLERIKSLAIPPAWTEVRICTLADGHLQAVGLDAKGRRQYLYHPRFRERRDAEKFDGLARFAKRLPIIRARVEADLARRGLPREKVLAAVVRLLDLTLIRIGNREYAERNGSYGLTTLRDGHVDIEGGALRFAFKGKSGRVWRISLRDRRLAKVVRACQELPGQHLFQYIDESGEQHAVGSIDVNAYLRDAAGGHAVTAKAFRTWSGTVLAAQALLEAEPPSSATQARRAISAAMRETARALGNTPAVCRSGYVHPRILDLFAAGELYTRLKRAGSRARPIAGLEDMERAVLAVLRAPA